MSHYKLALIGFGGVNRALAELIRDQSAHLEEKLGYTLSIVAITDLALGTWIKGDGIDPGRALSIPRGGSFADQPGGKAEMNNRQAIQESDADIIVEATFTNPVDGEPASTHVRWALEAGKHVTTTNKGPIALHRAELEALAAEHDARFEYEGTVMSGTPVIRFAHELLAGNTITGFEGIMNGTSNYVLGRMGDGLTQAAAIEEAQKLGYAEADPTADIGGSDVRLKVAILASELLPAPVSVENVDTRGIGDISSQDIEAARAEQKVWKLIGRASVEEDGSVAASVSPVSLAASHPLAGVSGPTNAVSFHTEFLGAVTVSGPGAGLIETAYALLSDITAIDRSASA